MVSQTVFPPDIRLEKEIRTLAKAGYNITVVCNQYEKGKSPGFEYCKIVRIKAIFKSTKLNKILNFPLFLNPRYLFTFFKTMVKVKPDFIHAHDLPMAPLGLFFGKLFGKPVISDMHENYPAALQAFQKKGLLNFLFKNYKAAKVLEKYCVKRVDRVITVVEENSQRLMKMGVDPQKLFVVSNTVDLESFAVNKANDESLNKYKDRFVLLYTGFVSPERGLDTVVLGMKYLMGKLPNAILLIVGDGISIPGLKNIVAENKLDGHVKFIKWPGHENLGRYLSIANVGISPQPNNDHWNNSIPHKLFEYMSKSIPVLVTDAIPLKRIIIETKAGLSYKSNDPEDFAEKVLEMASFNIDYGKYGRKAVEEKYNWNRDAKILLDIYEHLN